MLDGESAAAGSPSSSASEPVTPASVSEEDATDATDEARCPAASASEPSTPAELRAAAERLAARAAQRVPLRGDRPIFASLMQSIGGSSLPKRKAAEAMPPGPFRQPSWFGEDVGDGDWRVVPPTPCMRDLMLMAAAAGVEAAAGDAEEEAASAKAPRHCPPKMKRPASISSGLNEACSIHDVG
eukprot:3793321-Prymnesium_polylepis.1